MSRSIINDGSSKSLNGLINSSTPVSVNRTIKDNFAKLDEEESVSVSSSKSVAMESDCNEERDDKPIARVPPVQKAQRRNKDAAKGGKRKSQAPEEQKRHHSDRESSALIQMHQSSSDKPSREEEQM